MHKVIFAAAVMFCALLSCGSGSGYKSVSEMETERTKSEAAQDENPMRELSKPVAKEPPAQKASAQGKAEILNDMVKNGKPSVIDFNATWCGPCRVMEPVFKRMAEQYGDKYNFISIDVDQRPDLAEKYQVTSIPAFIFVDEDGVEGNRIVGAVPEERFVEELSNPAWF